MNHQPVLLNEVIESLDLKPGQTVLDATLGDGGHTAVIFELVNPRGTNSGGLVIGLDADPRAIERAEAKLGRQNGLILRKSNFRHLKTVLNDCGVEQIDRALFDLGLSSPQLADPTRGFSFQSDGPLFMNLDGDEIDGEASAAALLNRLTADQLTEIIKDFGEENHARKIAEAIVSERRKGMILGTKQLVTIIESAVPLGYRLARKHFATKTFQALRIATNDELGALQEGLEAAWKLLTSNGRIAVISFHSLEARIVKDYFRRLVSQGEGELISKHPIKPSRQEVIDNPRARSATLRIIQKK